MTAGLQAGDIDFSRISNGSVDRFKKLSNLKMYENASLDYYFITLNVQDKVLKDLRLRQAIRLAVDVPDHRRAYDDKWEQAYGIIPKSMGLGYWKDAPKYKRNVDAARSSSRGRRRRCQPAPRGARCRGPTRLRLR